LHHESTFKISSSSHAPNVGIDFFEYLLFQRPAGLPPTNFGVRAGGNAYSWTNEFPALEYEGDLIYPEA
jgi:hypothetical protein